MSHGRGTQSARVVSQVNGGCGRHFVRFSTAYRHLLLQGGGDREAGIHSHSRYAIVNSKLFPIFGASVFGTLGGWVGARIGPMIGLFLGMVGMGLGLYLARRFVREYLE